MAASTGILNTPGITNVGSMSVTLTSTMLTDAAAKMLEKKEYDAFLYGSNHYKTWVPAPAPPILHERLDFYERMMTGPRPVSDYPIPLFVGDYLNGIILPADWDPDGHLEGQGEWQNRTRFFSEGRLWNHRRIPLAPKLPGA